MTEAHEMALQSHNLVIRETGAFWHLENEKVRPEPGLEGPSCPEIQPRPSPLEFCQNRRSRLKDLRSKDSLESCGHR